MSVEITAELKQILRHALVPTGTMCLISDRFDYVFVNGRCVVCGASATSSLLGSSPGNDHGNERNGYQYCAGCESGWEPVF